jgi:hypothetical protein
MRLSLDYQCLSGLIIALGVWLDIMVDESHLRDDPVAV